MSIQPVVRIVKVAVPPERAFDLFTTKISAWWPQGKTVGKAPHLEIVIEPFSHGRWFERDADGVETTWGKVLAWEPPGRLLLGWQLNSRFTYDPSFLTEVEITFVPLDSDGTVVRLEHRNLERFGADAERVSEQVGSGWPERLSDFVACAAAQSGQ